MSALRAAKTFFDKRKDRISVDMGAHVDGRPTLSWWCDGVVFMNG